MTLAVLSVLGLSGISLVLGVILTVIGLVGSLVVIYLFTISKVREGTALLQEQAGEAQKQLIDAMKMEQEKQAREIAELRQTNQYQAREIINLKALVTQAANVEALRKDVETGFKGIHERLDNVTPLRKVQQQ